MMQALFHTEVIDAKGNPVLPVGWLFTKPDRLRRRMDVVEYGSLRDPSSEGR